MVFFLLALGACGESSEELREREERAEQRQVDEEARKAREESWKTQSAQTITLPPIPDVVVSPDGTRDITARLNYLIDQNPDVSVRIDMSALAKRGEILLEYDETITVVAQFRAVPGEMIGRDPLKVYPTIVVSPYLVDAMKGQDDALILMNGISHEFHHYRQWRDGDEKVQAFFGPIIGDEPLAVCPFIWKYEREAYWRGCALANAWGNSMYGEESVCTQTGTPEAFDVAFLAHLKATRPSLTVELCTETWEQIAYD